MAVTLLNQLKYRKTKSPVVATAGQELTSDTPVILIGDNKISRYNYLLQLIDGLDVESRSIVLLILRLQILNVLL